VTAGLAGALRACAAGLYYSEAGTELLIGHGAFLRREDFSAFICEATSITDGTTAMAWIDWATAITTLNTGNLPVSSGERSILQLAASIAAGTPVDLRDTITSLDDRNLGLLLTAIRHAAGHRPG
jgi:hypothetical protein